MNLLIRASFPVKVHLMNQELKVYYMVYFIVISQEIYETKTYFKKSKRVISSKNFNKETLEKLFTQFI